ncbi:MAG: A24 family peptidase [Planctomycetaceae bacterium]|nr:A24 family peptidase [Planctomycetaceae bacterium]
MISYPVPASIVLVVLFAVGLYVGRLLNICALRFADDPSLWNQLKSLAAPWAVCRKCHASPHITEEIPVAGWIINGRRCRDCRARVPVTFTVIELLTGFLFAYTFWWAVPMGAGTGIRDSGLVSPEGPPGPEVIKGLWSPATWLQLRWLLQMFMICGLIVATEIDRRLRLIPDGSTIPVLLVALMAHTMFGQLYIVPIWFQDPSTVRLLQPLLPELLQPLFQPWDATAFIQSWPHLHGLLVSLVGALAGAGSVWIVRQIGFLVLKQEAMGFGDVVLMGMIGSVIGWQPVLAVFMVAPMLAILVAIGNFVAHRDNEIPYGPFLSIATILLLLTWPHSWPLAKRFFDMGPVLVLMGLFMIVLLGVSLQLVQVIKRLLGFSTGSPQPEEAEWTSADHLSYYTSERPDEQTGEWSRDQWPGSRAGRGLKRYHDWHHDS